MITRRMKVLEFAMCQSGEQVGLKRHARPIGTGIHDGQCFIGHTQGQKAFGLCQSSPGQVVGYSHDLQTSHRHVHGCRPGICLSYTVNAGRANFVDFSTMTCVFVRRIRKRKVGERK